MALPWKWLKIDGWKAHGLPAYFVHSLIDDLTARAESKGDTERLSYEEQDVTSVYIDEPGIAFTEMPTTTFDLDGLTVEMPVHDVGVMLSQLQKAQRRTFTHGGGLGVGMDYYKLHGFCRCIVLTPDLRAMLLEQMEARWPEAEAIADAYIAGRYKEPKVKA